MARVPDLIRFCKKHNLVMITVSELARYRMDLDDGAALEALEGFIPVCPRFSAQGVRRFGAGDVWPASENGKRKNGKRMNKERNKVNGNNANDHTPQTGRPT